MRRLLKDRIAAAGSESGLTIVEVLVASVILVLGAGATFGLLGAATKNAQRAKATQVTLDLAQEELERLHGLPYASLALNTAPTSVPGNSLNPRSRISGSQFALKRSPMGEYGTLVLDPEKGIAPESEFFSGDTENGGIAGTLFRFVVWRNDPACSGEGCEAYKQVVVAVKPDKPVSQSGESGYVEVQSGLIDPAAFESEEEESEEEEEEEGGEGNPGEDITAQQFFLSDTPCAANGTTVRQEITADHLLHNTLGTCASGLKNGASQPGAPDALLLAGAPDLFPEDETKPGLYDYADDFYLEPTPDTDKGLQIRRDDIAGCNYNPAGATNPESQVHRWISDKMTADFEVSGKVTLEFYTRTLNDALYPGTLCVFLFERAEAGLPPEATDTLLVDEEEGDAYWKYPPEEGSFWPRNVWTRVRLTMELQGASPTIDKDHRLGVALGVDRGTTPADAIPIMYDHPNYPTRLEVDTDTPIEVGG